MQQRLRLLDPDGSDAAAATRTARLRAQALEVAAEPVLIVGGDGMLRDCNAAALILLARHRAEVVNLDAAAVRTLVEPSGDTLDWHELVGPPSALVWRRPHPHARRKPDGRPRPGRPRLRR